MERTTVKYIIRSLVILETKRNTLLNKIASLVNVPGQHGIVQADGRLDVCSRRQVVKCAVLLDWSCSCSLSVGIVTQGAAATTAAAASAEADVEALQ